MLTILFERHLFLKISKTNSSFQLISKKEQYDKRVLSNKCGGMSNVSWMNTQNNTNVNFNRLLIL